jgi:hypothetical protein
VFHKTRKIECRKQGEAEKNENSKIAGFGEKTKKTRKKSAELH